MAIGGFIDKLRRTSEENKWEIEESTENTRGDNQSGKQISSKRLCMDICIKQRKTLVKCLNKDYIIKTRELW